MRRLTTTLGGGAHIERLGGSHRSGGVLELDFQFLGVIIKRVIIMSEDQKERKKQRPAAGSLKAVQEAFSSVNVEIEPPAGYKFSNAQERKVWKALVAGRAASDWRELDLFSVWKIMKLEVEAQQQQKLLEEEGAVIVGARGGPIENPRMRILDVLERRQIALLRTISLNVTKSDPRVVKRQAETAQKAAAVAMKDKDAFSHLLARSN